MAAAASFIADRPFVRWSRTVGWLAFSIGMVLRVIELVLASRLGPGSAKFALGAGLPAFTAAVVFGTACGLVGAIIVSRRPGNAIGWIFVLGSIAQGILGSGLAYAAGVLPSGATEPAVLFAWLNGVGNAVAPLAAIALVLALYPEGRFVGPRWRIVVPLAVIGSAIRTLEVGFGSSRLVILESYPNPHQASGPIGDLAAASEALGIGFAILEVAAIVGAASLVMRYRRAQLDGRRQIQWLLLAGIPVIAGSILLAYGQRAVGAGDSYVDALAILFLSLALPPVATLIAITRYRLYEIDRIVNRALLYGSLTAILAGVFTAAVSLAQRAFVALTGETSDAAIVLTTLVVATLYAPLRKRLEAIVDRQFKFDEARFGAYRDEVARLVRLVEPHLAAQRLVGEAVRELGATGGAILDAAGRPTATAGSWPVEPALRIQIPGGRGPIETLALGARGDREPFDARIVAELEDVARLVALAATHGPDVRRRTRSE